MLALSHALLGVALIGLSLSTGIAQAGEGLTLEVFTAAEFPVSGQDDRRLQGASVTVYTVDGLQQFETGLSQNLPAGAEAAKTEALRRIGELDDIRLSPAKVAATGLAKAVQYGVNRYPAIVVNRTAVLYGVTNLVEAAAHYEAWQEGQSR